jgi:hypothetical protein
MQPGWLAEGGLKPAVLGVAQFDWFGLHSNSADKNWTVPIQDTYKRKLSNEDALVLAKTTFVRMCEELSDVSFPK